MRNFDFPKLKINHLLGQTSFRHLGYRACFQALAWNTSAQVQRDKIPSLTIFAAELPARAIKWSYRAGLVSIQSKPYGCANLRHTQISAQNEFW